jgi:hypothetical protein
MDISLLVNVTLGIWNSCPQRISRKKGDKDWFGSLQKKLNYPGITLTGGLLKAREEKKDRGSLQ